METKTAMVKAPDVFDMDGRPLTTVQIDGKPWFLAKDVCEHLGIKNVSQAVNGNEESGALGLADDEKLMYRIYISSKHREALFVNESGLYNLIFQSKKPEARQFTRWVTNEVLPTIRRTGSYFGANRPATRVHGTKNLHLIGRMLATVNGHDICGLEVEGVDWIDLRGCALAMGYDVTMPRHLVKGLGAGMAEVMHGRHMVTREGLALIVTNPGRRGLLQDRVNELWKVLWPDEQAPEVAQRVQGAQKVGKRTRRADPETLVEIVSAIYREPLDREHLVRLVLSMG